MKKLLSLCLSLILALTLAIPAAASSAPTAVPIAAPANGVSVQVNGENVTFPDASPEITNGRTMVPMRAVLEALGAEVDYNADTRAVTATLGGYSIYHVIGTDAITAAPVKTSEDSLGAGSSMTMDTKSYVKNGSTLVPLRFFSQALGYEVYWDEGQRTAVVIDKNAFVAETDKSFTVLNEMQSAAPAVSGNMSMDMDMKGELKILDGSLDTPLPFSAKMSALYSAEAMNISGSMDLSAIAALAEAEAEEDPEMAAVAEMLKDLSFQMICGKSMWINVPVLTAMLGRTDDMWIEAEGYDMASLTAASAAEDATIGSALYDAVAYMSAEVPSTIYEDLTLAAGYLKEFIGDDTFTKTDGGYTWEIDEAKSAALAEMLGETPDSFSLTASVEAKADGSGTFTMDLKSDGLSMSMSGSGGTESAEVKVQVTVPEVCEVTVECTAKAASSDEAPAAEPPAGAGTVSLEDLMNAAGLAGDLGVIGGADGPTAIFTTKAA